MLQFNWVVKWEIKDSGLELAQFQEVAYQALEVQLGMGLR